MNNSNTKTSVGGIGFLDLLAIAFIVLKLCGVINWSWWWVLAPIWIQVAIIIIVVIIIVAVGAHDNAKKKEW